MKMTIAQISAVILAGTISTTAVSETEIFKLEDLTCFDVISQPDQDSLFLMGLLIGHASSVTGNTEMSGATLQAAIENLDAVCGENPNMPAISVVLPS